MNRAERRRKEKAAKKAAKVSPKTYQIILDRYSTNRYAWYFNDFGLRIADKHAGQKIIATFPGV